MPTRGVLLMLILVQPARAAFSMDITICDSSASRLWKREAPKARDDIMFIHECRIYSGRTRTQNVLTQCMKNVEAHITVPGSSKTLRADFLTEELEWCTIKEVLVSEGDGMIVRQTYDCKAYSPIAQDEFRVYLSCDPHFGHPVVILMLRPMRKIIISTYIEALFYGWCSSIVVSATILLLIIAYKPELVEIIHKVSENHASKKKKKSYENALAIAKLEARKKLLNSPRSSAGSSGSKIKSGKKTLAERKEKDKKYSETKAKYLSLKRRKKSNKKKAKKK